MSFVNRDFIDALQAHDKDSFAQMTLLYLLCFAVTAPLSAWMRYSRSQAALLWRKSVTKQAIAEAASGTQGCDNPEERIQSDIAFSCETFLRLSFSALMSLVEALVFGVLLYSIHPLLLAVLLLYMFVGIWSIHRGGRRLTMLKERQIHFEANMRRKVFNDGLNALEETCINYLNVLALERRVEMARKSYFSLPLILPLIVIAPQCFDGSIGFGTCLQAQGAFYHVLSAGSLFISEFEQFSELKASMQRVAGLFKCEFKASVFSH
jgi:ABC-type uncharacterized transport system fused permease/ATPase subunit